MSQQTKQMYHPQECCFEPVPYGTPERADPQRSTMTPGCLVGCILLGLVHGYINRELDISSKFLFPQRQNPSAPCLCDAHPQFNIELWKMVTMAH